MNKLIGISNLITGITIGMFAPILSLMLLIIMLPFVFIGAAFLESGKLINEYGENVRMIAQFGFRIGGNGIKRLSNTPTEDR